MNKQKYRSEASGLEPILNVGKSGIESIVEELIKQLKKRKMVKVRFLRSAYLEKDKKVLSEDLANLTNSELIEIRGNTAVFRRKG